MNTRPDFKIKGLSEIRAGCILISQPWWQENVYKRSVVLIIDHGINGSVGIILNKMTGMNVNKALPTIQIAKPVLYGGPVDTRMVSYIHSDKNLPDSIDMGNGLYMGGDYEQLAKKILNKMFDLSKIKFCAGFVEWNSGQLKSELLKKKWWLSEINHEELFSIPLEDLWTFKLLSDGHVYGLFSRVPDPSAN